MAKTTGDSILSMTNLFMYYILSAKSTQNWVYIIKKQHHVSTSWLLFSRALIFYCSPGSICVWHQSPFPPKPWAQKVTRAWVSLPFHLLPAEVWGNFLQVAHGERGSRGLDAAQLCCTLWYCQGRVMAHCSNSHYQTNVVWLWYSFSLDYHHSVRERNGKMTAKL